MRTPLSLAMVLLLAVLALVSQPDTARSEAATAWVSGYNSKSRLVSGLATGPEGGPLKTFVGIELVMEPGWKTYWRMPGDAGGLAPSFVTAGSTNLARADVHYPVPQRMVDSTGTSLGYKSSIVFPVEITPRTDGQPVVFDVTFEYGICREICVPAEAKHRIVLPAAVSVPAPDSLQKALQKVPSKPGGTRPRDPSLVSVEFVAATPGPRLVFVVHDPGGVAGTDLFVEAPDGIFLPLPTRLADDGKGDVTFALDMSDGISVAEISRKPLLLTMAGSKGQAEALWIAPELKAAATRR